MIKITDNFPAAKVTAYTLEEGNVLRIIGGSSSALSLRTSDGCVRVGRTSVIRINRKAKHFDTWEELQEAVSAPRVSTKSGRNETIVVVRKGDPFPVAPTEEKEEDAMAIEEAHQRIVQWGFLGYTAAIQRVSNAKVAVANNIMILATAAVALVAAILIGIMALVFFSADDPPTEQPLPGINRLVPTNEDDFYSPFLNAETTPTPIPTPEIQPTPTADFLSGGRDGS